MHKKKVYYQFMLPTGGKLFPTSYKSFQIIVIGVFKLADIPTMYFAVVNCIPYECGTTHFLVNTMDEIINILEDNRSAAILTSIDYSKAFNRLEHGPCLRAFADKGASNEIIKLLSTFLSGRVMTVRVGNAWSTPRAVNAGAPQGSVLGSYLFTVGIDHLEREFEDNHIVSQFDSAEHLVENSSATSTPVVASIRRNLDMSPVRGSQGVDFLPRAINVPEWLRRPTEPKWRDKSLSANKYIDDGLHIEKYNMKPQVTVDLEGIPTKQVHAARSENFLEHVQCRAEKMGMRVNKDKTMLMCVSTAVSYAAKAYISGGDGYIESVSSMKMLGFLIQCDGGLDLHVRNVVKKLRSKTWALRTLRKAGFTTEDTSLLSLA